MDGVMKNKKINKKVKIRSEKVNYIIIYLIKYVVNELHTNNINLGAFF